MKTKSIIAGILLCSLGLVNVSGVEAAELGTGSLVHVTLDNADASFAVTYEEGEYDLALKVDNGTIGKNIYSDEVIIPFTISNGLLEDVNFTVEVKAVDGTEEDVSRLVDITSTLKNTYGEGSHIEAQKEKTTDEHLSLMVDTSEGWTPEKIQLVKDGFSIVYTISQVASSEDLVK